jgi:hypothetical protein
MDGGGNHPKRCAVVFSGGSSSIVLCSRDGTLFKMRKHDENYIRSLTNYCVFLEYCTSNDMGEFPIQLEELGVELGKQFNRLEELSIQLEQQPIESVFKYWGLR